MDPFQGKMVRWGEEGLTLSPAQTGLGKLISLLHLHVYLLLTACERSLLILFSLAYSPAPLELQYCKPQATFQLIQCPLHLGLPPLHA